MHAPTASLLRCLHPCMPAPRPPLMCCLQAEEASALEVRLDPLRAAAERLPSLRQQHVELAPAAAEVALLKVELEAAKDVDSERVRLRQVRPEAADGPGHQAEAGEGRARASG